MSRFGTIMTTQRLVKSHLTEARIRIDRKEFSGAIPHLLRALEAQQTAINCLSDLWRRPRERQMIRIHKGLKKRWQKIVSDPTVIKDQMADTLQPEAAAR